MKVSKVWKSVFGALGAGLTALASVAVDGTIDMSDWATVLAAVVVTSQAVYWAPANK